MASLHQGIHWKLNDKHPMQARNKEQAPQHVGGLAQGQQFPFQ